MTAFHLKFLTLLLAAILAVLMIALANDSAVTWLADLGWPVLTATTIGGVIGGAIAWILGHRRTVNAALDHDLWRTAALNAQSDAIWMVDAQGHLRDINAAACSLLGLTPMACLGHSLDHCLSLAPPQVRDSLSASFAQDRMVLQSGRPYRNEESFTASNGFLRSFDFTRTPILGQDGSQVLGVITVAHENTAIRIQQMELKRLHARMQSILNSVSEGILVSDRFGLTTFVNPAVTRLTGWDSSDLLGNYQHEILHHSYPDGRLYPRNLCPVSAVQVDGQPRSVDDEVFWGKDGQSIPVEYTCTPVLEDNRTSGVVLVFRDISQRRQVEEELSRLRRAVEHCPVSIVITDDIGRIQFVNPAFTRITGYTIDDVAGNTPRQLKSGYHSEDFYRHLWATITSGQSWEGELCNRKKDGTLYWEMARIAPVTNADGKIINFVAVKEDVSSRHALQEALRTQAEKLAQSNADLEQFAYAVSHDLQEPLRMVTSYMQLLKRRYVDQLDQDAHEFIDFAVDAGQRLTRMIADLLTYSRVQTRQDAMAPVSMDDVLQNAQTNLAAALTESNAQLHLHPMPMVMGDRAQLISLMQNLLGNALKYRDPQRTPAIQVRAVRDGDQWRFSISDNGIGIDSDQFDRIFGVFQRLHTRTSYDGTGIGLALCKRVAERHGGRIWVESQPGVGSTFHVTLPAAVSDSGVRQ